MINYDDLGDLADGRRLYVGDFRGIGRAQILFHNASDRNWWIGTFDGAVQEFVWALAGNTSGFGDLQAGHIFWVGRFSNQQRDQLLFYYPGDQNWWLGTYRDSLGRFTWVSAGNTSRFGNLLAGHRFWRGRFTGPAADQILFFYPGDQNWWLGSWDTVQLKLRWTLVGNTAGYGNLQAGQMLWTGRFSRQDRDQMLLYNPGDQRWFLGSYDATQAKLLWTEAGQTTGFGKLTSAQKFWVGQFSRPSFSDFLFYNPSDQNWWLAQYDVSAAKLSWLSAGNTSQFGDLLAGHKFWIGGFSDPLLDQVLFYYPGDQHWWLSTFNAAAKAFTWKQMASTDFLGDGLSPIQGALSRCDRSELLVQAPARRQWWLCSIDESNDKFWWRLAVKSDAPRSNTASTLLRRKVREAYGRVTPGCAFLVTRNGRPFADGSFGAARRPGAPDGELAMTASSIVHVGSITKFLGAVAILRLIQDWNKARALPPKAGDPKLAVTARAFGAGISLDQKVLPLVSTYLDAGLLASYGTSFPGAKVDGITIRQVLDHQSGLPRIGAEITTAAYETGLNGLRLADIVDEPNDESPTRFDLSKFVTALLKQDATWPAVYNNDAYAIPAAIIEAVTGIQYNAWMKAVLFSDPEFSDLAPRVTDGVRSARYHGFDGANFTVGNHHPDYTRFSLAGGYYVSATVFAEWVEAVMSKKPIGGQPILDNPEILLSDVPGLGRYSIDRFQGYTKNGSATRAGGGTNGSCAFLSGYGNERVWVFTEVNAANVDADAVRDTGAAAVAEIVSRASALPTPVTSTGSLRQTVTWNDVALGVGSARAAIPPSLEMITVNGVTAQRTRLFGSGALAGGKSSGDLVTLDLRGCLRSVGAGFYVFRLASDDGAYLWLNDELIADNHGDHPVRVCESDGVWLEANSWYPFRARWYNSGAGGELSLEWRLPLSPTFSAVPLANFSAEG